MGAFEPHQFHPGPFKWVEIISRLTFLLIKYTFFKQCNSWLCLLFHSANTLISGVIPFAGGSYLAYSLLDSSIAKPPGDQLTPVYMFVTGCLAAAFAKVTYLLVTCIHKSYRH